MDAKQLKDEHRDTYDAVYRAGREAGAKEGEELTAAAVQKAIDNERKRVAAHLNFTKKKGANSGNILKIAHENIVKGAECDQLAMSEYMTAENDAQALDDRESEDGQTPKPGASNPDPKGADLTDGVAAGLKARRQKVGS